MGAILNGMALVKVRPYGSGFLIFSDYGRPPIRLAAIMEMPVDLRLHARLDRRRRGRPDPPADRAAPVAPGDPRPGRAPPRATPTRWSRPGGSSCSSTTSRRSWSSPARTSRRSTAPSTPRPPALARAPTSWPTPPTASPTSSCWPPAARSRSASRPTRSSKAEGIKARVVSMPSLGAVRRPGPGLSGPGPAARRHARVSVEQASTFGWAKYVGPTGTSIGMRSFGASAPLKDLQRVRVHRRAGRRRRQDPVEPSEDMMVEFVFEFLDEDCIGCRPRRI